MAVTTRTTALVGPIGVAHVPVPVPGMNRAVRFWSAKLAKAPAGPAAARSGTWANFHRCCPLAGSSPMRAASLTTTRGAALCPSDTGVVFEPAGGLLYWCGGDGRGPGDALAARAQHDDRQHHSNTPSPIRVRRY